MAEYYEMSRINEDEFVALISKMSGADRCMQRFFSLSEFCLIQSFCT